MPVLPDVLSNIFATGITYTGSGEAVPLRSAVSFKEANLLYEIVRKTQPTRSLEIGMGQGISTLAILGAIKDNGFGHHHVVDPYETAYDNAGLAAVDQAALTPYMTFHPTHSEYVIPHLSAIDLAFIDASHLFDLTLADFVLIDKKLCVGGLIGFHDLWLPAYRQVLDYVLSNRAYTSYNWAPGPLVRWCQCLSMLVSSRSVLRRIFNRRLFTLPPSRGAPNLTLIQKMQEDSRNWDFHVRF